MRRLALVFGAALVIWAGCVFDSEQVAVTYSMQPDSLAVATSIQVVPIQVDLNSMESYRSRKGSIRGLSDVAFLGHLQNTGLTVMRAELWMTSDSTSFSSADSVRAKALQLWGGVSIPGRGQQDLNWNDSATRVNRPGMEALGREVAGDGTFTLYTIGAITGTNYNFVVRDGALLMVLSSDS